jgi:adenylate cyclase
LIADGFTDYFAQPIIYTTGETNAVSWSSMADSGFSDEALAVLDRVNRPLARLTRDLSASHQRRDDLSAYVGRNSGDQILSGKVHRGDGEEIEAAILFTDLVNFTAMSDALDGPQTGGDLNDVFDMMVPPVADHGGEILKFMGDGFFRQFSL